MRTYDPKKTEKINRFKAFTIAFMVYTSAALALYLHSTSQNGIKEYLPGFVKEWMDKDESANKKKEQAFVFTSSVNDA